MLSKWWHFVRTKGCTFKGPRHHTQWRFNGLHISSLFNVQCQLYELSIRSISKVQLCMMMAFTISGQQTSSPLASDMECWVCAICNTPMPKQPIHFAFLLMPVHQKVPLHHFSKSINIFKAKVPKVSDCDQLSVQDAQDVLLTQVCHWECQLP